ncbi:MAG: hypothetical protein IKK36_03670 [Bacteroidales bacterium]|nr:hypothetical protein [Bacteroidales bacterium]
MGLFRGLSFSWKRALGISGLKTKVARKTGIPTTRGGMERKIGRAVVNALTGSKTKKGRKKNKRICPQS